MDIRNNNINSARPEGIRNGYLNGAGRASSAETPVGGVQQAPPVRGDRVEISDAARSQAGDQKTRELALAKKALDGVPSLSTERVNEIQDRIQNGYYNDPDVLRKIATKVTADLSGSGI